MPTCKRTIDILLSAATLPIALPIITILACWIKLDSKGPVVFRQTRIGLNQNPFEIYKLRTMTYRPARMINQQTEAVLAEATDQRITRAGRTLRALSLDELPQIFNIIKGDMSFVGPRPLLPEQLDAIPDDKLRRFSVRPGITGLAQVTGRRSLTWPEQLAADVRYADEQTLWLDLKILARTVMVVVSRQGLYGDPAHNWRTYLKDKPTDSSVAVKKEQR